MDKAEHLSKQWISTVEDHIDLGTMDERALLEPLRNYAIARLNHLHALWDYNMMLSTLAQASGWDTASADGRLVAAAPLTTDRWRGTSPPEFAP